MGYPYIPVDIEGKACAMSVIYQDLSQGTYNVFQGILDRQLETCPVARCQLLLFGLHI